MKAKGRLRGALRIALLGSLSILMLWVTIPKAKSIWELEQQRYELKQQKNQLQKENQELTKALKEIDSPQAVEKLAREQLGMVKKGEQFVQPLTTDEQ